MGETAKRELEKSIARAERAGEWTGRVRYAAPALVVALLGIALFLTGEPLLLAVGDWLVVRDELEPADVIHVLASGEQRTDRAIEVYKQGYAPRILFTGGWCPSVQANTGELAKARAVEHGVPADAIIADEPHVHNTYDEALRLRELLGQGPPPIHSVIVVSDPYHMRRAQWVFRRVLGASVHVQMAPVSWETSGCQRRWWTDPKSLWYVASEYVKLVYYYARYGLG